ncbi:hypothetical protein [Streptomyces sp. NRRL F-5123]|uniref:hypothetical protein n=1 Tax=Streptomyces sp. NRRL F-5123 TaxID=1463856 RepID=UPI0004E115C8|nr:hypothetical protein [Streptomyces sp. NRRL F-5123]
MARLSPGQIRAQLPLHVRRCHGRTPVIRGLSAAANRQIAAFERSRGLPPGEVAHAFRRWNRTGPRTHDPVPYGWSGTGTGHVRSLLEAALHTLHTRARRELAAALAPLDERALRRSLNDPFAAPDLPWWLRRTGV